jgi:hypothetical protein
MSNASLAHVTALSELLQIFFGGGVPTDSDLMKIAGRFDSLSGPSPKLVIAEPCTPGNCGVKGCHQLKADKKTYCSLQAKPGAKYCGRHSDDTPKEADSQKKPKAVKETPAQESVPATKPKFTFTKSNPVEATATVQDQTVADETSAKPGGTFSRFRPRGEALKNKIKATFFKRTFPDDDGDIEFIFTDDAVGGTYVYSTINDERTVVGKLSRPVNNTDEPLPEDFMEYVDQSFSDFDQVELAWFTANRISRSFDD